MTARLYTCPNCMRVESFTRIEENGYACLNPECELSERKVVHWEQTASGQFRHLYGWVLEPGDVLRGRYEIIKLIGKGGYGATYKAKFRDLHQQIFAIKETPRIYCDNEEDDFLLNLDHPGIPKLYDQFNENELHYIVMEFIEGESLQELIQNLSSIGLEQRVLKIAEQVCDILAYIHQAGVVHRDLKPENILIRRNGSIAIVDFGIAKRFVPGVQTRHLARAASQFYAPPEQYRTGGGITDPRSDIYSLGAILYFLLTRREPVDANNRKPDEVINPLPRTLNANISRQVEYVIIKAMSMNPDERFESMADLKQALIRSGSVTTRVCPKCGRLYRGANNICPQCGKQTNPLGATDTNPFLFRSGDRATNLKDFIDICYTHWDDAIWHLYRGDFETWLNSIQEGSLAEKATKIRQTSTENRNLGLNEFLLKSPFGRIPKLELSHEKIDFLDVKPGDQKRVSLFILNAGDGFLMGELQFEDPYLIADNYSFSCFPREKKQITFFLSAENIPMKNLKTNVVFKTNVGTKSIPVAIFTEPPELRWKVNPNNLVFKIEEHQNDMKGFTVEVITGNGKLEGTISTNQSWLKITPTTFHGRSQVIRVDINNQGLVPGEYQEQIEVKTKHGTKFVDVQLTVEPAVTRKMKKQPIKSFSWWKFIRVQIQPAFIFMVLFWILYWLNSVNNQLINSSPVVVGAFSIIGALVGLIPEIRQKINNKIISVLTGVLAGLIVSAIWQAYAFQLYTFLVAVSHSLVSVSFSDRLAFFWPTLFFISTGFWIGGVIGIIISAIRFRPSVIEIIYYKIIFFFLILIINVAFLTVIELVR
ncbi:protein kinase [candidate division KSB1 bacterium]|nr:protein kinase [candidate division KSB1 bacterium]